MCAAWAFIYQNALKRRCTKHKKTMQMASYVFFDVFVSVVVLAVRLRLRWPGFFPPCVGAFAKCSPLADRTVEMSFRNNVFWIF